MSRDHTPDSHDFPTRRYDLVKEFVIALVVVLVLSGALAAIFSSPDEKAITMSGWAKADPDNLLTTAASELAGTTTSATYGPPYNSNADGQSVLKVPLQKLGGVRIPIDSADLVLGPLSNVQGNPALSTAVATWKTATPEQRTTLERTAEAMASAASRGDMAEYMRLDTAFDRLLEAASRSAFALQASVPLHAHCRRFWYLYRHNGDLPRAAELHGVMMHAVAAGDEDGAGTASDALVNYLEEFARTALDLS